MKACPSIPFTTLLADTIRCHGTGWTYRHCLTLMPAWEVRFFFGLPCIGEAMVDGGP